MKTLQPPDEWLMAQVAGGNREQLEPLVRRYANRLLTFIERMVGNHHRAEELFQDVFLLAWQKRRQYDDRRPFKPWLFAIAANRVHEVLRPNCLRLGPMPEDDPPWPANTPDLSPLETAIATETAAMVGTAVARLPVAQRTVVVLRIWCGLSYAEIAGIVSRHEGAVRVNMHHGLTALREYLEPRLR